MSETQEAPRAEQQVVVFQTGITPGLEILAQVDKIFIKQEIEFMEVLFSIECNNRYAIINGFGQRILYAAENTDCCTRYFLGKYRPFEINIFDSTGQLVIQMIRPCTCGLLCCPDCTGNRIEVKAGLTGEPLGYVEVVCNCHCCQPKYRIMNAAGEIVFIVLGPKCGKCCPCVMCGTVNFDIVLPDDELTNVGQITKLFSGLMQELFTDADNFGATFPIDLDPRLKAVVLAAVFMIDFQHFQKDVHERDGLII